MCTTSAVCHSVRNFFLGIRDSGPISVVGERVGFLHTSDGPHDDQTKEKTRDKRVFILLTSNEQQATRTIIKALAYIRSSSRHSRPFQVAAATATVRLSEKL